MITCIYSSQINYRSRILIDYLLYRGTWICISIGKVYIFSKYFWINDKLVLVLAIKVSYFGFAITRLGKGWLFFQPTIHSQLLGYVATVAVQGPIGE